MELIKLKCPAYGDIVYKTVCLHQIYKKKNILPPFNVSTLVFLFFHLIIDYQRENVNSTHLVEIIKLNSDS